MERPRKGDVRRLLGEKHRQEKKTVRELEALQSNAREFLRIIEWFPKDRAREAFEFIVKSIARVRTPKKGNPEAAGVDLCIALCNGLIERWEAKDEEEIRLHEIKREVLREHERKIKNRLYEIHLTRLRKGEAELIHRIDQFPIERARDALTLLANKVLTPDSQGSKTPGEKERVYETLREYLLRKWKPRGPKKYELDNLILEIWLKKMIELGKHPSTGRNLG